MIMMNLNKLRYEISCVRKALNALEDFKFVIVGLQL